jgi:hypothetical protein
LLLRMEIDVLVPDVLCSVPLVPALFLFT